MNYFDWIERKLIGAKRPEKGRQDSIEFEPVDVSAMQGIIVGLPSAEEARLLRALFDGN